MSSRFLVGALCAVVTVTIWAGWLVVMRVGMASHLDVVDLIALRFAIAGIVMVPVLMRRGWALDRLTWTGNIWIGTSIEDMEVAHRADHLRQIPAAVRFISAEPLLGPVDELDLGFGEHLFVGQPFQADVPRGLRQAGKPDLR